MELITIKNKIMNWYNDNEKKYMSKMLPEFADCFSIVMNTVFVNGKWLKKFSDCEILVSDDEMFETMLTHRGLRKIHNGRYGIVLENGKIMNGDTSRKFQVLINKNWHSFRPYDISGLYEEASKSGY